MDLKHYITFLRRWWWLMALAASATALLAFLLESRQIPMYAAKTTILVNQDRASRAGPNLDELRTRERLAMTYSELLVKRPVLEAAIADLKLPLNPGVLFGRTRAEIVPGTELIKLTVQDPDPQQAADLANAIARVFSTVEGQILSDPYAVYRRTLYVVEPALPEGVPVSPNIPRSMSLAAAIGIMLTIALGFLFDYFDDRLKSAADLERVAAVPVLTAIPRIQGTAPSDLLITASTLQAPAAEAYRMVRAWLDNVVGPDEQPIKSIAITSSMPQEGKTVTAANLAVAMAQAGKRVVLVDTDLRRPTLHKFFNRSNTRGVTTAIMRKGGDSVADHLVSTDVKNLTLMASGPVLPNPVSYLGAARMVEVIDALREQADLVIFDTPAVLPVVDASLIASACDATVLVVRAGVLRESTLRKALTRLTQTGARVLGVVVNQMTASQADHAQYYKNVRTDESIELIDFAKASGERQQPPDNRSGRVS